MAKVRKDSPRYKSAVQRAQRRREERSGVSEAVEHNARVNKIRAVVGQPMQSPRFINDASAASQTDEALRKRKAALRKKG